MKAKDKVFILAAGHQQYLDACRKLKLSLRQAVYVDNETKLAGVANITVHFQDGWWLHPKHREIYDALQVVGYQKLEAK